MLHLTFHFTTDRPKLFSFSFCLSFFLSFFLSFSFFFFLSFSFCPFFLRCTAIPSTERIWFKSALTHREALLPRYTEWAQLPQCWLIHCSLFPAVILTYSLQSVSCRNVDFFTAVCLLLDFVFKPLTRVSPAYRSTMTWSWHVNLATRNFSVTLPELNIHLRTSYS